MWAETDTAVIRTSQYFAVGEFVLFGLPRRTDLNETSFSEVCQTLPDRKKKHQQKQTREGIFENHVSIFHKSAYMMLIHEIHVFEA